MKYLDFLNEGREYKPFKDAQECKEYLEERCSISWKAFINDKSCLYRGTKNTDNVKDWSLLSVENQQVRSIVSLNYLLSEQWNRQCDNMKYFDRTKSVMFTRNIDIAKHFGDPCVIFLRDNTRVNAVTSDWNGLLVDDVFTIRNPGGWRINEIEHKIFEIVQRICKYVIRDRRDYVDFENMQNDIYNKKISMRVYYDMVMEFFKMFSEKIGTVDDYRNIINDNLHREILAFFDANSIEWTDINKLWDLMKINKTGVKSLNIKELCSSNTVYDEIWTTSDIILVTEDGLKILKNIV